MFAISVFGFLAPPLLFLWNKSAPLGVSQNWLAHSLPVVESLSYFAPSPHVHPKTASRASLAMLSISSSDTTILLFFLLKVHSLCLRRLANW